MSNEQEGGSPGFFSQLWTGIKKVFCTLVCAWKEFLILILVMVLTLIFGWIMVPLVISFFVEVIFAGPTGGATIILAILTVIVILLLILLVIAVWIATYEYVRTKIRNCWLSC